MQFQAAKLIKITITNENGKYTQNFAKDRFHLLPSMCVCLPSMCVCVCKCTCKFHLAEQPKETITAKVNKQRCGGERNRTLYS